MADSPIKVGGAYRESEHHVPHPTDMVAQYNTEGVGAHGRIEEVSPIFEVDKVKTAEEIVAALDPDNPHVPESRVLLPDAVGDNEAALDNIERVAQARLDRGVEIGGPTPAEREAARAGDEGTLAAVEQDRSNAASNSTGNRSAGQHEGANAGTTRSPSDPDKGEDEKPSGNASREEWATYAKSQGASEEDLKDEDGNDLGRDALREEYGSK